MDQKEVVNNEGKDTGGQSEAQVQAKDYKINTTGGMTEWHKKRWTEVW